MTGRQADAAQASLWETVQAKPAAGADGLAEWRWSFEKSTKRDLTHALHPWPAKFIPDIPARAIELYSEPGDTVLDPFCGSGTTALEALRQRRGFVMADINPLAIRVAEGKCEVPTAGELLEIKSWAAALTIAEPAPADAENAPAIPNIDYWFTPSVIAQLLALRAAIKELGLAQAFLDVVFSSILVGVSNQESETRYRRTPNTVDAAEVLRRFRRRIDAALGMAADVGRLEAGSLRREYLLVDARRLAEVMKAPADLAVFSPPYPNTFDYHLYHRFRMFWLGFDPRAVKRDEIGAHLKYEVGQDTWLSDMEASFRNLRAALKPGGHIVCVVGDGISKGKVIPSGQILWDAVASWGLRQVSRDLRSVPGHRKSFNLSDARLRQEEVLVLAA